MNIVIYLHSGITSNVKEQTTKSHDNLDLKNYYAEWKKPKKKKKRITMWFPLYKALENAN